MPLVAHNDLPAFDRLSREGYAVVSADEAQKRATPKLRIGLLNLMPDAALEATERQFLRLLGISAGAADVYAHVFTAAAMPRLGRAREHVDLHYPDFETVKGRELDALVLTGANPANPDLTSEPFWDGMIDVIEWGRDNVCSTLCSCLATHAVVKRYHQVERIKLPQKRWGVYSHQILDRVHFLTRHLNTRFDAPHSHVYEVTQQQLEAVGLTVLAVSEQAGVHLAVSPDQFQFVYFQGHPEYDFNSLFKEFKREVTRFANAARDEYPPYPENYFNDETVTILDNYRDRLLGANDKTQMLQEFPEQRIEQLLDNTWTDTGKGMFNNWLNRVLEYSAA